jgi:hypothetical protein
MIKTTTFSTLAFLLVVGFLIIVLLNRRRERLLIRHQTHENTKQTIFRFVCEFGFDGSDGNGEWATQTAILRVKNYIPPKTKSFFKLLT